ncbi:MAG TPA: hypothetical protein VGD71_35440 [Kribbella sp.]
MALGLWLRECHRSDRSIELDELGETWTLLGDEQSLVASKGGTTKLGFVCCC